MSFEGYSLSHYSFFGRIKVRGLMEEDVEAGDCRTNGFVFQSREIVEFGDVVVECAVNYESFREDVDDVGEVLMSEVVEEFVVVVLEDLGEGVCVV